MKPTVELTSLIFLVPLTDFIPGTLRGQGQIKVLKLNIRAQIYIIIINLGGGGLTMLYRQSLIAHQWSPAIPSGLEYIGKERQWLLIGSSGATKCAFLHCYIACQSSSSDNFIQWNEDLFHLITKEAIMLRKQGFMVIAMGDFNSKIGVIPGLEGNRPEKNRNEPMFQSFISEVNLFILNTLPTSRGVFTRFMGDRNQPETSSLLDYGLIDSDHIHSCTSFIIDDQARFDCGSDHALLECDIVLGNSPNTTWAYHDVLQYNYSDTTDFTAYKNNLDKNMESVSLTNFQDLQSSEMLAHITDNLNLSAKQTFGLKVKKKRKSGSRLPRPVVSLIKAKNHLSRMMNMSPPTLPQEMEEKRQELLDLKFRIKESISEVRFHKRVRLRSKLFKADPTRRRFWRFLKSQIKSAGSITAMYKVFAYNTNHIINLILKILRRTKWYLSKMKSRRLCSNTSPPFSRGHECLSDPSLRMLIRLNLCSEK